MGLRALFAFATACLALCLAPAVAAVAPALLLEGKVMEGAVVVGTAAPGAQV